MQQIGSAAFFEDIAARAIPAGELPVAGSFELTFGCNLHCAHCYIGRSGSARKELSTEQVLRVLDRLHACGVLVLLLTGGEPLLRKDFREIYRAARQRGFLLSLYTNATLIDASMADFFAAQPPRRIEVTVYGHTPETYERVTGVPGSFAAFRAGVDRLLARNLPVHFKAMVLKSNWNEIEDICAWAGALEKSCRLDAVVNPGLDGCAAPLTERLPPEDLSAYLPRAPETTLPDGEDQRLFKCGAGVRAFHIDPLGCIHPCMMWRASPYNLLEGTIEAWKEQVRLMRARAMPMDSACVNCPARAACPNCPALSQLETGQAGSAVSYFCRAMGRADA